MSATHADITPISRSLDRRELVSWTARMGAVTAEALAVREQTSPASARARLLAAERAGFLRGARPLAEQPRLFTATRAGLREAGLGALRPARVSASGARHAIACAGAAAALERSFPSHRLIGEPEIAAEQGEQRPRLSARLSRGRTHRPDLALSSAEHDGLPVAVEIELTVKAPARLREICVAWARCGSVAGVLYLASDEVLAPLSRAIERAHAGDRIAVVALGLERGGAVLIAPRSGEPSRSPRSVPVGGSPTQNGAHRCPSRSIASCSSDD